MTKARARERAKARAAQKSKKHKAKADQTEKTVRHSQFDPGAGSIKAPTGKASVNFGGAARRGAARGG